MSTLLDWYRHGHLSPYLATASAVGNSFSLVEALQPDGDMSDPPVSDLVLAQIVTTGVAYTADWGAGRLTGRSHSCDLFLTPASTATEITLERAHHYRGLGFPVAKYAEHLGDVLSSNAPLDFGRLHASTFRSAAISNILGRIWETPDLGTPAALLFAEGAALVILAELAVLSERPIETARGGLAPWAARRVVEYLHAHLADEVSLTDLAAVANLSPFHFARMFKRTMGKPPHAFQRQLRCERAKTLLGVTRLSITHIALEIGYESSQSFARMFRAETGVSPLAWRRAHYGEGLLDMRSQ